MPMPVIVTGQLEIGNVEMVLETVPWIIKSFGPTWAKAAMLMIKNKMEESIFFISFDLVKQMWFNSIHKTTVHFKILTHSNCILILFIQWIQLEQRFFLFHPKSILRIYCWFFLIWFDLLLQQCFRELLHTLATGENPKVPIGCILLLCSIFTQIRFWVINSFMPLPPLKK